MSEKFDLSEEFRAFVEGESDPPPRQVRDAVIARVKRDLHPSAASVFLKVLLCVALSGTLSLLLCPQFGLSFMRHSGLHEVFMALGTMGCHLACGAFFSSVGLATAAFVLRPEELRTLSKSEHRLLLPQS